MKSAKGTTDPGSEYLNSIGCFEEMRVIIVFVRKLSNAKATLFFENMLTSSVPDLGGHASPTLCSDTLQKCPNIRIILRVIAT